MVDNSLILHNGGARKWEGVKLIPYNVYAPTSHCSALRYRTYSTPFSEYEIHGDGDSSV